ncbi:MAG: hypothetical protein J1F01_10125, partial [Oscillospiraceae bacterium]|nr:hypothetical protein [Oscillospiraceae bacterium]
ELTMEEFERYYNIALKDGLSRIDPNPNHSFSMVSIFFLCDKIAPEVLSAVKKRKYHEKYPAPGAGWAELRLAAVEVCSRTRAANPMGKSLLGMYKDAVR